MDAKSFPPPHGDGVNHGDQLIGRELGSIYFLENLASIENARDQRFAEIVAQFATASSSSSPSSSAATSPLICFTIS